MKPLKKQVVDGVTGAAVPVQIKSKSEKDAIQFVTQYYNSPGFDERFNLLYTNVLPRYLSNQAIRAVGPRDKIELNKNPFLFKSLRRDPLFLNNAYYDRANTVRIGPIDFSKNNPSFVAGDYGSGYDDVIAHELGHVIDSSIGKVSVTPPYIEGGKDYRTPMPANTYSDLYPIFRNSKAYRNAVRNMSDTDAKLFQKYPSETGDEDIHDARPSESYADLIRFRYQLNKLGIFDSRKSGQRFGTKHLQEFKRKNKTPQRLFKNFSDGDIIWMMNNVAQNNTLKTPNFNFIA